MWSTNISDLYLRTVLDYTYFQCVSDTNTLLNGCYVLGSTHFAFPAFKPPAFSNLEAATTSLFILWFPLCSFELIINSFDLS